MADPPVPSVHAVIMSLTTPPKKASSRVTTVMIVPRTAPLNPRNPPEPIR
jgi:hypothetical protein